MNTLLPLFVGVFCLWQCGAYAKAHYVRRMVMLRKVMNFLDREDASIKVKLFASAAFQDAISFRLPAEILNFQLKRASNDKQAKRAERSVKQMIEKDPSSKEAMGELNEIVEMMFQINLSFNRPFIFLLTTLSMLFKIRKEIVTPQKYFDAVKLEGSDNILRC
ncbi:hypothetical protein [Rosenbergiella collisarenosi]|uniref:hypothetical protein n=1 Tax=Rosenbergiella collisarenosi TaxID=1544695 RepID=UPI001F4F5E52|nr:hypothetical protein [Rosenbergiella collisarenosi]